MLRFVCIMLFGLLGVFALQTLSGHGSQTNALAASPTPTPVGIQFDQIDKMLMGDVSAAAPGSFQPDYQAIVDAPKGKSGGGGMLGKIGKLGDLSDKSDEEIQAAIGAAMNPLAGGTLLRHAFAWGKGWERIDEPTAARATIYKCDLHQVISLDLAKKTYRIGDDRGAKAPPEAALPGRPGGEVEKPGTAQMQVSVATQVLGPKNIETIDTTGYKSTTSMKLTNVTGSCDGGQFSSDQVAYISALQEPRRICVLPKSRPEPAAMVARGGCVPTISQQHSGPPVPDRFYLYRLLTMKAGQEQAGSFGMLSERGNVKFLAPDDLSLFAIPAGYTREN